MRTSNTAAALLCVAGMAIVGSSVSISQLVLDFPPFTGQATRYALAAAALFAVGRRYPGLAGDGSRGRPTGRDWLLLTLLAATGLAAFNACILFALPHADPAVLGTVIGAAPLGFALLGPLLAGRRPAARLVTAALVVVAGAALVQGTGRVDAIGLLWAFGALGGEIAFSLLAAAVLPRLGPVRVAAYGCALAVPLLLVAALWAGEIDRWRAPTAVEAAALGYLAVLMTVVAFLAWFTGLRQLGIERAGMISGVLPVATLVTAAVQAGRLPAVGQVLGVLLVAVGLMAGLTRPTRRRAPVAAENPAARATSA